MDNIPTTLTERQRTHYIEGQMCKGVARLFLIIAAVAGSVTLTAISLVFSNMDAPGVVYGAAGLLHIGYGVMGAAALMALVMYIHEKQLFWLSGGLASNGAQYQITRKDIVSAIIKVGTRLALYLTIPIVVGVFFADVEIIVKPLTCQAVHHTHASSPNYPLYYRVRELNCPDLTKSPEER